MTPRELAHEILCGALFILSLAICWVVFDLYTST